MLTGSLSNNAVCAIISVDVVLRPKAALMAGSGVQAAFDICLAFLSQLVRICKLSQ